MAKPHPALIEIAAGRAPGRVEDDVALIESAFQHRMGGLAFHAADTGTLEVGSAAKRELAGAKLVAAAHNSKVERAAVSVLEEMKREGWSAALFKGVATARRWYPDTGTRPTADVDLFLDPAAGSSIEQILDQLAPDHGLSGHAQRLFDAGRIQSVDFMWDEIWIDVHVDPIKVGVELPGAAHLWQRTEPMHLGGGVTRFIGDL